MAKVSPIFTNFTNGEVSPRLLGRVDFEKFNNSCELLENFIIMSQGGATKRTGTYFAAEVKNSAHDARLMPFVFSTIQAYILEFGNLYFRIYMNGGRVESPPGTPVEVVTPYPQTSLGKIRLAQSSDIGYLAHPSFPPRKIERTSHTAWTCNLMDFLDGPYLDENLTTTTMQPSAATGIGILINASSTVGVNDGVGFLATDVGRLIRIKNGATWGYAKITARNTALQVVADVKSNFAGVGANASWMLGAWSDTTGWPASVSFHEDRLVWGGTTEQPQTVWFSRTGQYENYAPTLVDGTTPSDIGMAFTLLANQSNPIRWMSSGDTLAIGTVGGEFIMSGATRTEAITPTSVSGRRNTTRGSQDIDPVRVDTDVIYMQRSGRKLRQLSFDYKIDAYQSVDVSVLAEHMTKSGIRSIDYQQEPHSIIWMARNDGMLVGCTFNKEQNVNGWHRHPLGGTNAKAICVAVIPVAEYDELWLVVERTIGGVTKKYVEFMNTEFDPIEPIDKDDAFYVDCGLTYEGPPATVLSGLDHLEGQEVTILANGSVKPNQIVVGGEVVLDEETVIAHVGLPYVSKLKTVKYEGGGDHGTSQGKTARTNRVVFRFLNTLGGQFGTNEAELEPLLFRAGDDVMNESPPLFTGDKPVTWPGSYERSAAGQAFYYHDQPYPATLLAIMPESIVYG